MEAAAEPRVFGNGKIPVCVSAEAAAVMNDPAAPADECVIPDCLRSPAVAIRMSSSQRRDVASGALVSRRWLPPSHAALLISALLRVCVDVSAFIHHLCCPDALSHLRRLAGEINLSFVWLVFHKGIIKLLPNVCQRSISGFDQIGLQHVGESRLMW